MQGFLHFSQIFAIFDDVFWVLLHIWHSPLWKIIKYCKKFGENKENSFNYLLLKNGHFWYHLKFFYPPTYIIWQSIIRFFITFDLRLSHVLFLQTLKFAQHKIYSSSNLFSKMGMTHSGPENFKKFKNNNTREIK